MSENDWTLLLELFCFSVVFLCFWERENLGFFRLLTLQTNSDASNDRNKHIKW